MEHEAAVCAARHFIAAYESAVKNEPVNFGGICLKCEFLPQCHANWMETAAPLFDDAGIHPQIVRSVLPEGKASGGRGQE